MSKEVLHNVKQIGIYNFLHKVDSNEESLPFDFPNGSFKQIKFWNGQGENLRGTLHDVLITMYQIIEENIKPGFNRFAAVRIDVEPKIVSLDVTIYLPNFITP